MKHYRDTTPAMRAIAAVLAVLANVVVLGGVIELFVELPADPRVARAPPAASATAPAAAPGAGPQAQARPLAAGA